MPLNGTHAVNGNHNCFRFLEQRKPDKTNKLTLRRRSNAWSLRTSILIFSIIFFKYHLHISAYICENIYYISSHTFSFFWKRKITRKERLEISEISVKDAFLSSSPFSTPLTAHFFLFPNKHWWISVIFYYGNVCLCVLMFNIYLYVSKEYI